ncbi:DUF1294 domain-containing protein, partial [Acinetobacter baumannii]
TRRGARRIPERTLLLLALIGGTPGAYAGRWLFRHKTRKQPFVGRLHAIAVVQAGLLAAWLIWGGEGACGPRPGLILVHFPVSS